MPNDPNKFLSPDAAADVEEELLLRDIYIADFEGEDIYGGTLKDYLATNGSSARHAFIERSEYRDDAFPFARDFPTPFDLWYDKGLYGKVDEDYNTIASKNEWVIDSGDDVHGVDIDLITPVLKKIPSDDQQIFAMNFVVDAFEDFQEHMNLAATRGDIYPKGSIFVPMKVKRGWTPINNRYKEQMEAIYQGFAATFLGRNHNYKKVNNFKKFMRAFSDFLQETARDFPISKSGFVLCKRCPLVATGLAIELADADHGDDRVKYEQFIGDKNFGFFVGAARRFGFRVDKNAPWRLVADIKSDIMQDYMNRYPELPPEPIPSGTSPVPPCEVLKPEGNAAHPDALFQDVIGQKVNFIRDPNSPAGQNEAQGIITGIECSPTNPENAKFILTTICPRDDNDLLDRPPEVEAGTVVLKVPERKILAIREPLPNYMSNRKNVLLGRDGTFEHWLNRLHAANTEEPGAGRRPLWLNTKHAGSMGSPILLDVNDSIASPGQFFKWTILSEPQPGAGRFMGIHHTFRSREPDNYRPNPHGGLFAEVPVTQTDNGIGFLPDAEAPGTYEIQVELMDSDGNRLGNPAQVTIEYCIMGWGYFAGGSSQEGIPVDPAKAVAILNPSLYYPGLLRNHVWEHYSFLTADGERKLFQGSFQDTGGELTLGTHPDTNRNMLDQMIWVVRRWYSGRGNVTDAAAHITWTLFNTSGTGGAGQIVHGLFRSSFMSSAVARLLDVVAFDPGVTTTVNGRVVSTQGEKDNATFAIDYWLNHLECFGGVGVVGGVRADADEDTRPGPVPTTRSGAGYDSWNYGSGDYGYRVSGLATDDVSGDDEPAGGSEGTDSEMGSLDDVSSDDSGESYTGLDVSEDGSGQESEVDTGSDVAIAEDIYDCTETQVKVRIYPDVSHADNFVLAVGDNTNFYNRRSDYQQIVLQYNSLLSAYQERVRQWDIWFAQRDLHIEIHRDDSPTYGGPLTFDNIFNRQFEKTMDQDIPLLKNYIQDFYNSYVLARPVITKTKINKGGVGTTRCLIKRDTITKAQMNFLYSDSYWAKFYYSLRMRESGQEINQAKLKDFQTKSHNILSIGSDATRWKRIMHLIDEETKGVFEEKLLLTTNSLYDTI